jgi:hypothetical protein
MSELEALNFLKANRMQYVFLGPYERQLGAKDSLDYPFLKPVHHQGQVTIYKMN